MMDADKVVLCLCANNGLCITFIKVSVLKNSIREKVQTSELSEYMMRLP
jgi:hypothetical protein